MRWDERQKLKAAQEESARRDVQEVDDEVDQNWAAACEWIATNMLKYLEDSEVLKVSTREFKEHVLSPDEWSVRKVRIARQARSEKSKKLFQIFRQGANAVLIASMAGWEEHLKGLVIAWRSGREHSSERQNVLSVLMQIFQELRELEEQKTKEELDLVQRKHKLIKW